MNPQDCKFYETCSASLCPLDPELRSRIWLPEENQYDEICRNPEFKDLQFIKTQKKIGKAIMKKKQNREDYFTWEMIKNDITVKSGIQGIPCDPPDTIKNTKKWYSKKEGEWVLDHPQKKALSQEEVERRRIRMKSVQKMRLSIGPKETEDSEGIIPHPDSSTSQKAIDGGHSL